MTELAIHYDTAHYTADENAVIECALTFAAEAHRGQKRRSGEPYITHPVAVAEIVAGWGLDSEAVTAALLHDTVEDTDTTLTDIEQQFGATVAGLVDGLTKLAQIGAMPGPDRDSQRLEASNENLRKLLLATARDVRVVIIKLADRLHNLRTLKHLPPDAQQRIALESLGVYAPLADRLGMGQAKGEIEDLSFQYSQPEEFSKLKKAVSAITKKDDHYLAALKHELQVLLKDGSVTVREIEGRQKHLYSIYKKLVKVAGDMTKIYDLIAIRIIVDDVPACYQAMGLIHQRYKPLIYRIKDYIAVPKPNGYRSLHTTVFAEDGRITEIQIRTPEMHETAEFGLAAHFYYDAQKMTTDYARRSDAGALPSGLGWVNELAQKQQALAGEDFAAEARLELFTDRIFVFSPKGDLYDLPEGATPIDFAFAVHSDIGLRTLGAKVNGRLITLDSRLENRDVVEIMVRREPAPNRDWLGFVKTPQAKARIRAWFRAASRDANIASGRSLLENELKVWSIKRLDDVPRRELAAALESLGLATLDDLLAAVGEGTISLVQAIRRLIPDADRPASVKVIRRPASTGRVLVEGDHIFYTLAPCCGPVYPQPIVGYITRGSGVTVHRDRCPNLPTDTDRLIVCYWETVTEDRGRLQCRIRIEALNRIGLIRDITMAVSAHGYNIGDVLSYDPDETRSVIEFSIEVPDLFSLADLLPKLEKLPGITSAQRITS